VHGDRPKGFVEIGGRAIIARSLERLRAAGVSECVLVVGWQGHVYRAWAQGVPGVVACVENADFATTGSLRSLLLGASVVPAREVLVVESDLLYEARAVERLLASEARDVVLTSGFTRSGDEVWIYEGEPGRLRHMSKQRAAEAVPLGELVGLSRFSPTLVEMLRRVANTLPASAHYEDGLNAIAAQRSVTLLHVPDLVWCEIDDPAHLARARDDVWPRIVAADAGRVPVS
jgi:2-aminoethylphosphonate-pyruvate transaminase